MDQSPFAIRKLALLVLLTIGACHCKRHTLVPSVNTVDPATHEPYQRRLPKASARQVAGREAMPDPPSAGAGAADHGH